MGSLDNDPDNLAAAHTLAVPRVGVEALRIPEVPRALVVVLRNPEGVVPHTLAVGVLHALVVPLPLVEHIRRHKANVHPQDSSVYRILDKTYLNLLSSY